MDSKPRTVKYELVKKATKDLRTVKRYAIAMKVSTSYIYKLIKEDRLTSVTIDGVHFIDVNEYPSIQLIKK